MRMRADRKFQSNPPRVWDEKDAYGDDRYMENFAAQSNWKEVLGEVGDGDERGTNERGTTEARADRSLRDRLLELGRSAGVEAPPASVLEDLRLRDGRGHRGRERRSNGKRERTAAAEEDGEERELMERLGPRHRHGMVRRRIRRRRPSSSRRGGAVKRKHKRHRPRASSQGGPRATHQAHFGIPREPRARRGAKTRDPDAYQFALIHADPRSSDPPPSGCSAPGTARGVGGRGRNKAEGSDEGEDAALAYEMLLAQGHEGRNRP